MNELSEEELKKVTLQVLTVFQENDVNYIDAALS